MIFVDSDGNYPRYVGDLVLEKPDWNTRKKLPEGWERVYETSKPREYLGNVAIEDTPYRAEDGKLYQKWTLSSKEFSLIDIDSIRPQNKPV